MVKQIVLHPYKEKLPSNRKKRFFFKKHVKKHVTCKNMDESTEIILSDQIQPQNVTYFMIPFVQHC